MNRRDMLKGILAACAAPYFVPVERLMRIKPIITPADVEWDMWDMWADVRWMRDGVEIGRRRVSMKKPLPVHEGDPLVMGWCMSEKGVHMPVDGVRVSAEVDGFFGVYSFCET